MSANKKRVNVSTQEMIEKAKRKGYRFGISGKLTLAAADDDSEDITLGDNGYSYTLFSTGSKPVILFDRRVAFDNVGFISYIYRDPEFVGGTPIGDTTLTDFRNASDINPQPTTCTLIIGLEANGQTGDVSSLGEETFTRDFIFGNDSNQGNGGLIDLINDPIFMLPNTQYLLIFKNMSENSPQMIGSSLGWAEFDKIDGLIIQNGQFVAYNGAL